MDKKIKFKACPNERNIKFTLMFYNECCQGSPKAAGLRCLRNRSLLEVNEDFDGKHNAEVNFLAFYILASEVIIHNRLLLNTQVGKHVDNSL